MTDSVDLEALKRNQGVIRLVAQKLSLKKIGREWVASCPFHLEKTPSFKIYCKNGIWMATCHGGCGSFNLIQVVQKTDNTSFPDAVHKIREFLGESETDARVDQVFQPVIEEPKDYKTYPLEEYTKLEKNLEENQEARDWLAKERGLHYPAARQIHVGYKQSLGKLARGPNADIEAGGWFCFPRIRNERIVGLHYRSMRRKAFVRQPGMATELFNDGTVDPLEPVYLTEGEFDTCILEQAGFRAVSLPNATTHLTPDQKDLLLQAEYVVLAGDTDPKGEACMVKLGAELGERACLLKWPDGCKDANAYFEKCGWDTRVFKARVEELTALSRSQPMRGITNLYAAMATSNQQTLSENPLRLHFPWRNVDEMVILLPGSVLALVASKTGTGKTTFLMNSALYGAMKHNEVVINYSAELSVEEYATIVASHLLRKNRTEVTSEDIRRASRLLGDAKFYIGRDPDLVKIDDVLDLIEAAIRRLGATICILDHFHFLCTNEADQTKAQENACKRIKLLASKYHVKFINVGQPRKPSGNQSKRYEADIFSPKGSESFMSDADAGIILHREDAKVVDPQNPPKEPFEALTKIKLVKGRSQGKGRAYAELICVGEHASFVSMASEVALVEHENMFSV